ncbi:hypothetical protein [Streptomyces sp. NPDC001404]|uniref:hypothetical protein n=1 Tax=Streptomyces sp. NPDC001404 TaxID=3364571 RepID=UPI0036A57779
MTDATIRPGQVYRSCDPRGGPRVRIERYTPGHDAAWVVDADTGKRGRRLLVTQLHPSPRTRHGKPRRSGYALEEPAP